MTLQECIRLHHEAEAKRPAGHPIRIHRAAHLRTTYWRQDANLTRHGYHSIHDGRPAIAERDRCGELAATGEHLGLDRVGTVVETAEVTL